MPMIARAHQAKSAALVPNAEAQRSLGAARLVRWAALRLAIVGLAAGPWSATLALAQPKQTPTKPPHNVAATPAPAPSNQNGKSPGPIQPGTGPVQGQQLCVSAARANLRSGPGPKFRVTWEVNRYMPLLQVGKEGDWLKVRDVDGDLHWISEKLITLKRDCVTVKADKANIRKAPNGKAETWFTVDKYTSFRRVGQKDNWVKIEYEGETMWVAQALVWPT